ncbi:hypothetical protein [Nitrosomonas sp. Is37]|uniref:hypothetical protein n=1 Tax=Nitrosomonas sp. Is37 TaxID=3080535 RepID=UPI00294AB5B7|nr:hypothetical protein [Nitrosomonas sp. Is37]MDV6345564.1 hypothetical protein [Nitrosomonas sp. Is37]
MAPAPLRGLTTEAFEASDKLFGSVLVAADGTVLAEDRNCMTSSDRPVTRNSSWRIGPQPPSSPQVSTV